MKYRLAKKLMARNVLLNLWLKQSKLNFKNLSSRDRGTELGRNCAELDKDLLLYELTQLQKIQSSMHLRNYHFYHYLSDRIWN